MLLIGGSIQEDIEGLPIGGSIQEDMEGSSEVTPLKEWTVGPTRATLAVQSTGQDEH